VNNIKASRMSFSVFNDSDSASVSTTSDQTQVSDLEFDEVSDLSCVNFVLDHIIFLDQRIRVANGSTIMCHKVWNSLVSNFDLSNLAQFVLGFNFRDWVNNEATFDIPKETEVLRGLGNVDDVHKTSWEVSICSDFSINLNEALFHNCHNFLLGQGILQSVSDENNQRKTFS